MSATLILTVRRSIRADPARLFDAWTRPEQLVAWWGPAGMVCAGADVDLRVGGAYRIVNAYPDGREVSITGEFERVAPPRELVYTWRLEPGSGAPERVTVRFEDRGATTEVIVLHERIADQASRDGHERGWSDCLDGLAAYVDTAG